MKVDQGKGVRRGRPRRPTQENTTAAFFSLRTLASDVVYQRACERVSNIVDASREQDIAAVSGIVESLNVINEARAVFLLIEVSQFYENIGDAPSRLGLLQTCVDRSQLLGDLNLQRKAYNNIAIAYGRVCDFENACFYLEKALEIAIGLDDPFYRFACLCNVVALLKSMGLINEAKQTSLKLQSSPSGTTSLNILHLQNAINGAQLAIVTNDFRSAELFNRLALKMIRSNKRVSEPWKAYVVANNAWCLTQNGMVDEAVASTNQAIQESLASSNGRVNAILLCARARNAIYQGNADDISSSKRDLQELLCYEKLLAIHREELLLTLVELYATDDTASGKQRGMDFLRQLREHLVNTKHRSFFSRLSSAEIGSESPVSLLRPPSYKVPAIMSSAALKNNFAAKTCQPAEIGVDDYGNKERYGMFCEGSELLEVGKRSRSYCLAEDWAVAADHLAEHADRHCFLVGYISGLLATRMGFDDERAVSVEMACRLHDIGKLTIGEVTHRAANRGLIDQHYITQEHAEAGERLLKASNDPILELAATVARYHHEWWNGCGVPENLAGDEIPIEARICSVADSYATLLYPAGSRVGWDKALAKRQISAMAGVQLDPQIVAVLMEAAEREDWPQYKVGGTVSAKTMRNGLVKAQRSLLDFVECLS